MHASPRARVLGRGRKQWGVGRPPTVPPKVGTRLAHALKRSDGMHPSPPFPWQARVDHQLDLSRARRRRASLRHYHLITLCDQRLVRLPVSCARMAKTRDRCRRWRR